MSADSAKLTARILEVRYRNDVDGFSILKVESSAGIVSVKGHTTAGVQEKISIEGRWTQHPKYGRQFEASAIVPILPETRADIERFLASGLIKGLGPKQAARVVSAFGTQTFEILDSSPERLAEISGLGEKTVAKVTESWGEHRAAARILAALAGHDVGPGTALRIYKHYGAEAMLVIRTDPYRLAREIRGIGFRQADSIGRSAGIPIDDPSRVEAGLLHAMREVTLRGSTGIERAGLVASARALLQLSEMAVLPGLDRLSSPGSTFVPAIRMGSPPLVFDRDLFDCEIAIATRLKSMLCEPLATSSREHAPKRAAAAARACQVHLAPEQQSAVEMALLMPVGVLTGGPGTGKTSTLRVILAALKAEGRSVVLGAPTGKAAKRMQQSTGSSAATLARLVGQGTKAEGDRSIEADVLIIDEASMVDVSLLDRTLRCLRPGASLLFVGDVDQLPSVGAGRVLADLIESGCVPVTRLTQVFRQAAESSIVRNAHRINAGETLEQATQGKRDFVFVASTDPADIVARVIEIVRTRIPDNLKINAVDVQVLSPMRKGETGVNNLNTLLQNALNPSPSDSVKRPFGHFAVGDRVVQTMNNYDLQVMNGESGVVRAIDREASTLRVDIDGKQVEYPLAELDQLDLAYAMSIHKSQGSQFPAVVIPVCTQHYALLQRAILYTGVTRASQFCVVVGDPKAVAMAIANTRSERRVTSLCEALMGASAAFDHATLPARLPSPSC